MFAKLSKARYMFSFRRILKFQDDDKKEFFNKDGCGLEIEFGVRYDRECTTYTETGLKKLAAIVKGRGKFVPDVTIGNDLNVEIVLNPFEKEELAGIFSQITSVIDFYDNFEFSDTCGVHANFRADDSLKKEFYNMLVGGAYRSEHFSHNKYKVDFMDIVKKDDGSLMTYEEYIEFQHKVGAKYVAVNFLKEHLVEFRSLDLSWDNISYVIDTFESAQALYNAKLSESASDSSLQLGSVAVQQQ